MKPKIIVALDGLEFVNAFSITQMLQGKIWGVKVNDLLVKYGAPIIHELTDHGMHVMADPKLHDIPNTMINCLKVFEKSGASFVTVHLSSGYEALKKCREATKLKLFGITILTSMPLSDVSIVYSADRVLMTKQLMLIAHKAGLEGVVCSADQVETAHELDLQTIVPGIRLPGMEVHGDDQVHKATSIPVADYIVVGRPVVRASDPVQVVDEIRDLIAQKEFVAA